MYILFFVFFYVPFLKSLKRTRLRISVTLTMFNTISSASVWTLYRNDSDAENFPSYAIMQHMHMLAGISWLLPIYLVGILYEASSMVDQVTD